MSSFSYYLAKYKSHRYVVCRRTGVKNSHHNKLSNGVLRLYSFQSAFSQINGKSISFDDQSIRDTQRLSVDVTLAAATSSGSFDAVTESQHSHSAVSNSELNLHSLSSDSGLHTGKTSEMSSDDFNVKLEDDQSSPTHAKESPSEKPESAADSGDSSSKTTPVRLSRVGSVKSRVNIFQHIENKPAVSPVKESNRPAPKKCKCQYYWRRN